MQVLRESIGPDGAGDGLANGTTDVGEEAQESEDNSNFTMAGGGHDSNFLADYERAAGDGNEDLAHYDVSERGVGLAEVDHEADAENLKRDKAQRNVFEFAGGTDNPGRVQTRQLCRVLLYADFSLFIFLTVGHVCELTIQ